MSSSFYAMYRIVYTSPTHSDGVGMIWHCARGAANAVADYNRLAALGAARLEVRGETAWAPMFDRGVV